MNVILGIVIALVSGVAVIGQWISILRPELAVRWGLQESPAAADTVFVADARGEAIWDALVLWPLPTAGILLALQRPAWPLFALVGGSFFIYFAGRGIVARFFIRRSGGRIGNPKEVRNSFAALVIWGITAIASVSTAIAAL